MAKAKATSGKNRSEEAPNSNRISVRPLTNNDWENIEKLFGTNGACGGCWCMTWRVPRGGKLWEESKGEPNRQAFRRLIKGGKVFGCLAFNGTEPIGWCCVGPRGDFARLKTIKALQTEWDDTTWSVTCFYIRSAWRGQSVAGKLLSVAVDVAKANGAQHIEG